MAGQTLATGACSVPGFLPGMQSSHSGPLQRLVGSQGGGKNDLRAHLKVAKVGGVESTSEIRE